MERKSTKREPTNRPKGWQNGNQNGAKIIKRALAEKRAKRAPTQAHNETIWESVFDGFCANADGFCAKAHNNAIEQIPEKQYNICMLTGSQKDVKITGKPRLILDYPGLVVLQKSSFYYSKTMICDDLVSMNSMKINIECIQKRGSK
jgi:hypothetical protein